MEETNKYYLAGTITYMREIQTSTGTPMVSVAIQAGKLDMKCIAFNENANTIISNYEKGDSIKTIGYLQNNSYEKDGVKQYTYQNIIETVK